MQAQQTLMVMAGRDKATGQRVWAVQSTSQTKAAGHLVFHILTWDASAAAWVCGCPSRKPCIHIRMASDASRAEQERADTAFDALTGPYPDYDDSNPRREELEVIMKAEPLMQRNDTGPRWLMGGMTKNAPSPVPAERQREVM